MSCRRASRRRTAGAEFCTAACTGSAGYSQGRSNGFQIPGQVRDERVCRQGFAFGDTDRGGGLKFEIEGWRLDRRSSACTCAASAGIRTGARSWRVLRRQRGFLDGRGPSLPASRFRVAGTMPPTHPIDQPRAPRIPPAWECPSLPRALVPGRRFRGRFRNRFVEFRLDDGNGKFRRGGGRGLRGFWLVFRRGDSGRALEAAAEFGKSLRARAVIALDGNLLEKRGEFHGAAVIARTDGKIEQALEDGSVARGALQDGFQEINRFLRQAIAGKQIDIGQSLRDVTLRFFIERGLGGRGNRGFGRLFRGRQFHGRGNFSGDRFQARLARASACICAAWFHLREFVPAIFRRWRAPWPHLPKFHRRTRAEPAHPAAGTNRWPGRKDPPATRAARAGPVCVPRDVRAIAPGLRGRPSRSWCRG